MICRDQTVCRQPRRLQAKGVVFNEASGSEGGEAIQEARLPMQRVQTVPPHLEAAADRTPLGLVETAIMKRSPMHRTPMKRGSRLVNPESKRRKRENTERAQIIMDDRCAASDAPGNCFGRLTRHEILPRGRGGSITDPDNIETICSFHNTAISQDVETMRWAYANGFLKHAWD